MMITTKLEKAGGRTSHVALNQKVEKLLLQASTTSRELLVSEGALKEAQASSTLFAKQHCSTVVPGWWYGYPYKVLSSRLTAKLLQVQLATRNEEGRLFSLHIHMRGAAPAGSAYDLCRTFISALPPNRVAGVQVGELPPRRPSGPGTTLELSSSPTRPDDSVNFAVSEIVDFALRFYSACEIGV